MFNNSQIFYPAQTNLELYEQLLRSNYSKDFVIEVNRAYFFAIKYLHTMFRGSGKPFICHLVGTASLMAFVRVEPKLVLSALLHALYQNRVVIENRDLTQKRILISNLFGEEIDNLIYEYTNFEEKNLLEITENDLTDKANSVALHLADHLEDLIGYSIFLHGTLNDTNATKGSYGFRKENYIQLKPHMLKLASLLKYEDFIPIIQFWTNFDNYEILPKELKSGYSTSFNINLK